MKKTIKMTLILGLALCLILSMTLLVACDPKNDTPTDPGDDTGKTEYTVSVVCMRDDVLTDVSVRLKKADGTLAGEKTLESGKATFELESGDYLVELAGIPEEYGYSPVTLTKDAPTCTIEILQLNAYTVSVTYPVMKDIYGSTISKAGPASGVSVSLYEGKLDDDTGSALEGKTPAATVVTDNTGTAKFKLVGETYTIVIPEYARGLSMTYPLKTQGVFVNTVTKANPYFGVTFSQRYLYGESDTVPIAFELGKNNVPLTLELLTNSEAYSVFYSFTPEKTGNYTFTATGNANVGGEVFGVVNLTSRKPIVVHMEAGKEYLFSCGISSTVGNPAYTVTIEEGGEIDDGGVEAGHTYPWTQGKGTLKDPFTTTTLSGEYTGLYVAAESHFYLAYTPSANETYTFSELGDNLWLQVYDDVANIPTRLNYLIEVGGDVPSADCDLEAGTTYYILIGTMNDEADSVGFKAEKIGGDNEPSNKATYTVTVVGKDSSGNIVPLEGINVTIRDAEQTTKTTDAQGKVSFEVKPGTYGILLSNKPANYVDNNDFSFSVSPKTPDLTITLTKIENTHTVSVSVKYADGKLAEQGLTVRLVASNNSIFDAKTDASGIARFDVSDGKYTVQIPLFANDGGIHDNGIQPTSGQEFHPDKYTVTVNGKDAEVEVAYDYSIGVDIVVKNKDGSIVAGALVEMSDDYLKKYGGSEEDGTGNKVETRTDSNGKVHFDRVLVGEYEITIVSGGKAITKTIVIQRTSTTIEIILD